MRTEQITSKTEVIEYDSLHEFYEYLIHTPFNDAFCWAKHSSIDGNSIPSIKTEAPNTTMH